MSFNNVGHLITCTITTLQHFVTLNHLKGLGRCCDPFWTAIIYWFI